MTDYALSFTASSDQYVQVPASSSLTPPQLTLEAWVYVPGAGQLSILGRGDGSNGSITDYILQIGGNGVGTGLRVSFFGAGGWDSSTNSIPINTWTHVAVTYDGTNKQFYINGVPDAKVSRAGPLYMTSGSPLYIGRQGTSCNCNLFQGHIDEVRIWNRVLTSNEISANMNQLLTGTEPGFVADYRFDEGSGTTTADLTGNGHTGALENGVTWTSGAPVDGYGPFTLGADSLFVGAAAGSNSIVLASPSPTSAWTATANAPWLHLSAANQSGAGSTNVIFSFDSNSGGIRTGTLTIGGQVLAVSQAGTGYSASEQLATLASSFILTASTVVDAAGNVYILDPAQGTISRWSPTNNSLSTLVTGLSNIPILPLGQVRDAAGNFYVSYNDGLGGGLEKWTATNNTLTVLSTAFKPNHLAMDLSGNIIMATTNAILKWVVTNSSVVTLVSNITNAFQHGLAVDAADNVYFTDSNNLVKWTSATGSQSVLVSGSDLVDEAAVDPSGDAYALDAVNYDTLDIWMPASSAVSSNLLSDMGGAIGMSVDPQGDVFFGTGSDLLEQESAFVNSNAIPVSNLAGTNSVQLVLPTTANLSAPFFPTTDQSWLNVLSTGNGSVTLSFTANTNTAYPPSGRVAHLIVLGQSIPVVQGPPTYIISTNNFSEEVNAGSDSVILDVTPNTVSWTNTANASWLHLSSTNATGTGTQTIVFTFDSNFGLARTGTLAIAGFTVTVTQASSYALAVNELSEGPAAGSDSVTLEGVPATNTWSASTTNSWLRVASSGTGSTNVSFSFDANTGSFRQGTIIIAGLPLLVDQAAAFLFGSTNLLDGPGAGMDSVYLVASYPWTLTNTNSWLHVSENSQSGDGDTIVVFGLDANTGQTRAGTLSFAGETITVTQAGSTYQPSTAAIQLFSIGNSGGSGNFIAVDGTGNVYAINRNGGDYYDWTEKWSPVDDSMTPLFDGGGGIAADAAGNLYICGANVVKWSPANDSFTTLFNGLQVPEGIAVDPSGNVWAVSESGGSSFSELYGWSATSSNVSSFYVPFNFPIGVASDLFGNIYVAGDYGGDGGAAFSELAATNSALNSLSTPSGADIPWGVAVDGSGNIYLTDELQAYKWSALSNTWTTLSSVSGPAGLGPTGIAVDSARNLYVAAGSLLELPYAFMDATGLSENFAGGNDALPPVLPLNQNLTGPLAPTTDCQWLNITAITNGVIGFSFSANPGPSRVGHINVLGFSIPIQQGAAPVMSFSPLLNSTAFQISFTNNQGVTNFTILESTNLALPLANWTVVSAPSNTAPGQFQFTVQAVSNSPASFYIIRSP